MTGRPKAGPGPHLAMTEHLTPDDLVRVGQLRTLAGELAEALRGAIGARRDMEVVEWRALLVRYDALFPRKGPS